MPTALIHVVTGCYVNHRKELLIVRKRNTSVFMLPGGKPEPDEAPDVTLLREWQEELGVKPQGDLVLLGQFQATAANEEGHQVSAITYLVNDIGNEPLQCNAEIEEYRWLPLVSLEHAAREDRLPLAPLLQQKIGPALLKQHSLSG